MKSRYFLYAALSVMVAASCTKEIFSEEELNKDNRTDEVVCSQNLVPMTFTADVQTKTAVEGNKVSWVDGDEIEIYWGAKSGDHVTAKASVVDGTATFSALVGEEGPYYAVYPAVTEAVFVPAAADVEASLTITIPDEQNGGKFEDAAIVTSYTTAAEKNFGVFVNAVSLVRFDIAGNDVTKVEFVPYSCKPAGGAVSVNTEKKITAASVSKVMTLKGITGPGTYYLAMAPGVDVNGVAFHVGNESKWHGVALKKSATDITLDRGQVMTINAAIDEKVYDGDIFITPEGAGTKDGSSWENAGDLEMFVKALAYSGSNIEAQSLSAWLTDGKTVYLGVGEYKNLSTANNRKSLYSDVLGYKPVITIKGGYDPATGAKSDSEATVFDGDLGDETYCGFIKFNDDCFEKVVLEDITVRNCQITNPGGAVYFGCPAVVSNCRFEACKVTGTNAGAVYVNNTTVMFTDCEFVGCSAEKAGGALFLTESGSNGIFRRCSFKGNSSKSTGGAIHLKSSATAEIYGCVFGGAESGEGNSAASTGGAINNGSDGKVKIGKDGEIATTFISNSTETRGGAFCNKNGELICEDVVFSKNSANENAAGIFISGTGSINLDGCTFSENTCNSYRTTVTTKNPNLGGSAISNVYSTSSTANDVNYGDEAFKLVATDCVFEKNASGGRGGAVMQGKGIFSFTDCRFTDNVSKGYGAGAIALVSGGTLQINKCSFIGNKVDGGSSTSTNYNGGVFMTNSSSANCYISDSYFSQNDATAGDGIAWLKGAKCFALYGCTFHSNAGSKSDILTDANPAIIANCTFYEDGKTAGVISNSGTDKTMVVGSIIAASGDYGLGTAGSIKSGLNLWSDTIADGKINGCTLDGSLGTDTGAQSQESIFGASPELGADNKLAPVASLTKISAATVKDAINTANSGFYTWLNDNSLWFSGTDWIPGARQN
ncbi:MAG: right-handed parallel beta-helix repeat-containing protein [Candidatus Cryptobacteroides sp.]